MFARSESPTQMAKTLEEEMPFLDHLEELRWRLFKAVVALLAGFIAAFSLLATKSIDLLNYLQRPVLPHLEEAGVAQLVYTSPSDGFSVTISIALGLGVIFAAPVILYQAWAFLSPALYSQEKRVVIPVLVGATVLFLLGMALAFYFVLPVTLGFLLGFQSQAFAPMLTVKAYFNFVFGMCLAFGAAFELPIVILALTAFGLVTPKMLGSWRRHALVGCLVLAALITPGSDPTSLFALTAPLYLLYEGSIVLSRVVYRRRQKKLTIGGEALA